MKQILAKISKVFSLFKAMILGLFKKGQTRVEIDSNHDGEADIIITTEYNSCSRKVDDTNGKEEQSTK